MGMFDINVVYFMLAEKKNHTRVVCSNNIPGYL
jgi:hypothetical protein